MWLYALSIKQGRTKKFASLSRGPYTILDRIGPVNYRVQLIGSTKTLVVHRNRFKICYWEPVSKTTPKQSLSTSLKKNTSSTTPSDSAPLNSKPSYADIVRKELEKSPAAGCTPLWNTDSDRESRPQRNHHPPDCYVTYVPH